MFDRFRCVLRMFGVVAMDCRWSSSFGRHDLGEDNGDAAKAQGHHNSERSRQCLDRRRVFRVVQSNRLEGTGEAVGDMHAQYQTSNDIDNHATGIGQNDLSFLVWLQRLQLATPCPFKLEIAQVNSQEQEHDQAGNDHRVVRRHAQEIERPTGDFAALDSVTLPTRIVVRERQADGQQNVNCKRGEQQDFCDHQQFRIAMQLVGVLVVGLLPHEQHQIRGEMHVGEKAQKQARDPHEELATDVWRLQEKFAAVTQLKRPDPVDRRGRAQLEREWWPHLRQVLADADDNLEAAEAAMQEAFQSMVQRPVPLNVVGPRSIVNVAAGVLAGKRRGAERRGSQQQPKGMSGIDAYTTRRGMNRGN